MNALRQNRNLAGILSLCAGVMIFSLQDAIIKGLSGSYPVTMAIAIRCLVALPILVVMVRAEVGLRKIATGNWPVLVLRGLILLVAYTSYYMALAALPLAEAVALFFTAPIIVTILAGAVLNEKVGARSWIAVFGGFIGVLIILKPGSALFEPAALLSILSAATYGFSMVIARRIGVVESATVMAFYQNGVYLLGAVVIALGFHLSGIEGLGHPSLDFLVRPWLEPTFHDLLLMGLCGIIAAVAMSLLTHAYRLAEANLVTTFEYTGMIWAPLWGFVFFMEIPGLSTILGTALIIAAGVFAMRVKREPPTAAANASS